MIEALSIPQFRLILIAGLLASVACGVIGSLVVVRRMASVSGGLSHAAFGGVGLAYLFEFDVMIGAGIFALSGALVIGVLTRTNRQAIDTLVSILWSVGMALGVVFVALKPGHAPDLTTYLFGNILYVSTEHVVAAAVLDVVVLAALALLFRKLQAVAFEEEFTQVMGVNTGLVFGVLMTLVALTVVVLIQVVGVILVIALLTLPAAGVKAWSPTLGRMMIGACIVGAACTVVGLFGSYWSNLPTGPLIILPATVFFLGSIAVSALARRA